MGGLHTRRVLLAGLLAALLSGGCRTVVLTAAEVTTPVFVGPVRPVPEEATRVRSVHTHAESSAEAHSTGGQRYGAYTQPVESHSRDHQDQAVVFDVALTRGAGDCQGCWAEVERIEVMSLFILAGGAATYAGIDLSARVIHLLGERR